MKDIDTLERSCTLPTPTSLVSPTFPRSSSCTGEIVFTTQKCLQPSMQTASNVHPSVALVDLLAFMAEDFEGIPRTKAGSSAAKSFAQWQSQHSAHQYEARWEDRGRSSRDQPSSSQSWWSSGWWQSDDRSWRDSDWGRGGWGDHDWYQRLCIFLSVLTDYTYMPASNGTF